MFQIETRIRPECLKLCGEIKKLGLLERAIFWDSRQKNPKKNRKLS